MVDGHLETTWNQTSHIIAAVYNSTPGRRKAVTPFECDPWQQRRRRESLGTVTVDEMLDWC